MTDDTVRDWRELAEGLRNMLDAETARYRRLEEAARRAAEPSVVHGSICMCHVCALRSVLDGEQ